MAGEGQYLIDWGVAARPMPGQSVSGDLHAVVPFSSGVLVAVVDGLGHGEEAAGAAKIAIATVEAHADSLVVPLIQRCHERLRGTRGVAMSVALFNAQLHSLTWVGVGNVEGVLLRADAQAEPVAESIPLRGGVVGYQLPPLQYTSLPIFPGDLLIVATDGIRSAFARELSHNNTLLQQTGRSSPSLAHQILAHYGKSTDDALVLVARYLGKTP